MKTLDLIQGSAAWLAARASYNCASEAPVMMGASKLMKRNELLHMKATGNEKEFTEWQQKYLLEKGHETEDLARAILEDELGEALYQTTVSDDDDYLLASLDGFTMAETTIFEHKMWNEELAAAVRAGSVDLPGGHHWQLEQQLLVTGAERVIFVCSDGTPDKRVQMEYRPVPGRFAQLMAGWKQFDEDEKTYQHVEVLPAATGKAMMALPALSVQLVGEVKSSNLPDFRASALAFIQSINTDLQTDQDFADAEKTVKFCAEAEERLDLVKQQALAQTASIDELFGTMDLIREELRQKRLALDKLVTARKTTIREEIRLTGVHALSQHIGTLNQRLTKPYMPLILGDFANAMRGKKTISSLRDAVDTELARAKIEANAVADRMQINLNTLRELAADYVFLFADTPTIVLKATDDLTSLVKLRIAEHKETEAKRLDTERERIRQEEAAKLAPPPPAAQPQATPQPVAGGVTKRPTDEEIIEHLATHYNVPPARVIAWLMGMGVRKKQAA